MASINLKRVAYKNWVNIGSGNDLLPDGNTVPEPIFDFSFVRFCGIILFHELKNYAIIFCRISSGHHGQSFKQRM